MRISERHAPVDRAAPSKPRPVGHGIAVMILICAMMHATIGEEQGGEKSLKEGLFQLHEIDLHIHAGKERPLPLNEWIDLSVRDGRKVMLLLDHLELHRMDEREHQTWIQKNRFTDWYPNTTTSKQDLMRELAAVQSRKDVLTFRGWEIWEGELEEGLERPPMKEAEVIGWHLSKAAWNGTAPTGKELIIRARQILEVQKEFPVPMIIFHPFDGHIKQVRETAVAAGRKVSEITKAEYRYFTPAQQKELLDLIQGSSVYIEMSRGWSALWEDAIVREAFIEDLRPLAEGGIKFTVSTDAHGLESLKKPYHPESYCRELGITAENVNMIVRELLAIRAKRNLN